MARRLPPLDTFGPVACALLIGLLVGFCVGTLAVMRSVPERVMRAD